MEITKVELLPTIMIIKKNLYLVCKNKYNACLSYIPWFIWDKWLKWCGIPRPDFGTKYKHTAITVLGISCPRIIIFNMQLSKPKLKQQLNTTAFEVRLHSYREIHHHPTKNYLLLLLTSQLAVTDQCSHSVLQSSLFDQSQIIGFWEFLS